MSKNSIPTTLKLCDLYQSALNILETNNSTKLTKDQAEYVPEKIIMDSTDTF